MGVSIENSFEIYCFIMLCIWTILLRKIGSMMETYIKKEQTFQGLLPIQFSKLHLKKFNKNFQYQKLTDRDVQKFHEYVISLNCLK